MIEKVKAYCESNGLSVSGFEKLCGLSNGSVSKWDSSSPSLQTLLKIQEATGIPLNKWIENREMDGITK